MAILQEIFGKHDGSAPGSWPSLSAEKFTTRKMNESLISGSENSTPKFAIYAFINGHAWGICLNWFSRTKVCWRRCCPHLLGLSSSVHESAPIFFY